MYIMGPGHKYHGLRMEMRGVVVWIKNKMAKVVLKRLPMGIRSIMCRLIINDIVISNLLLFLIFLKYNVQIEAKEINCLWDVNQRVNSKYKNLEFRIQNL